MKRLSLVSILCFLLALVGLSSCGESTLRKDILGEWVGDPKILKNLEWMGGGQTKVYSLDWTFGGGSRGWIKVGKTLSLREEGDEAYLNVSIVTPIIYNVYDDGLAFRFEKDSIQVEILEYLINGENYKDVLARNAKGEGKAALQSASDTVIEQLKEQGVTSALINLGGNVLTLGPAVHHEDGNWWIGIQNPKLLRGENVALLPIQEESIVTSGVYERVLEVDGKKYHHILDPNTGYPAETDVASLTIVSKQSVDCEIWTTRLFGKKAHEILFEVEQHPNIEAVMILEDNRIFYTSGLASKIQLLERKYSNG